MDAARATRQAFASVECAMLRFLNFSGAPALLIPKSALASWHGILSSVPPLADASPDFTDPAGVDWYIDDAFDFENPKTDYDHLCAALQDRTERILTTPTGALAISDGCDTAAWWPSRQMILTGSEEETDPRSIERLFFEPCGELTVVEPSWVLMNAAMSGIELLSGDGSDEHVEITLPLGRHCVERATRDGGSAYRIVAIQ